MAKVNYLNNRDILKEIHKSKTTYCSFIDPENDHQFDVILPNVDKINRTSIKAAREARADRIKRETGVEVDYKKIPKTDLVFRVTTWAHIPIAPPKVPKNAGKTKKLLEEIEIEDFSEEDAEIEKIVPLPAEAKSHVKVNFPPFWHYRLNEDDEPFLVGKSHWIGGMENGYFSKDHGAMTKKLAHMFMKLCERYATRSNWRGYTYNDEMRSQALLQLSQIGLQFDESKSQNPFAYYTATITNSFTRILNIEKKNQNIRDDILEANGLSPSYTRQLNWGWGGGGDGGGPEE